MDTIITYHPLLREAFYNPYVILLLYNILIINEKFN